MLAGLLGSLTFATAVLVGGAAVFAWSLVWSAVIWALWPHVFSPQFASLLFDASRPPYWKTLLIVAVVQLILKTNSRG